MVVPLLRLWASNSGGASSVPCCRTQIPHASWEEKKKEFHVFDISSGLDNMNINVPRALGWGFCQRRNCPEFRTLHSARFLHYWGLIGVRKIWLCLWVNFNNDFFRSYRWYSSSSKEEVKQGLRDPGEEPVFNGNNDKRKLGPQCSATRGPC